MSRFQPAENFLLRGQTVLVEIPLDRLELLADLRHVPLAGVGFLPGLRLAVRVNDWHPPVRGST